MNHQYHYPHRYSINLTQDFQQKLIRCHLNSGLPLGTILRQWAMIGESAIAANPNLPLTLGRSK